MSQPLFTKGPWTVCWQTYNGRRCNFHITASPYGSVRPLARTDWKIEWSEVEGEELVANGNLIAAAPDLYEVVRAVFGSAEFFQVDEKIAEKARDALAKAEGR